MAMRPLQILWRRLLRLERPRQTPGLWRSKDIAALLLGCALVSLLASWPWLVEPNLQPGMAAPFTLLAPKAARVIDGTALNERREQMLHRTTVQVVDPQASAALVRQLQAKLQTVRRQVNSRGSEVPVIALAPGEQEWLGQLGGQQLDQWQREVLRAQRRMLSQGLSASVAEGQLLQAANLQLENQPNPGRALGARLLVSSLAGHANLRNDPSLSQRRIEALITQQGIPTITVKSGDLITRQGQPITAQAFDVLDYFGLVNRRPRPLVWLAHFSESLAVCGVMLVAMRRWYPSLEPRQALLALAALLVVVGFSLWLGPLASPLVLLVPPTLLLAQGLGMNCGLVWLAAISLLWPLPLAGVGATRLLVASIAGALAASAAGRQRSRAELLQLAVLLPCGALIVQWLLLQRSPGAQVDLPSEALVMGGLLMAGLLIAPLVETFFGLLTRARLLELADLERPLLRRLSCEAPGTFEHTLMIAGLAEEGARSIGADVDLVRTGALYHDVGKLHGPQWFIENQGQAANPHDSLDDPFASAAILQAHVDEGLKLAKRYRLPKPLADFIPEHQGTLKMGYFLHQARAKDPGVKEAGFRYRGPTPNSRETAILMLADGCEAALRSLPPGTNEAEAIAMVRRIIEVRHQDHQLASSGMGRAELELLIRAFVRVWKRMRHRRIPYPIPARKAFSA